MKIGIFGGSFDPIHLGHLNLASHIQKLKSLDKVLFCLTGLSPFKVKNKPKASVQDRIAMLEIALNSLHFAEVSTIEAQTSSPSYTLETLQKLKKIYPNEELFFIAGEDVLDHFSYWKDPEAIIKLAKPLIGSRDGARLKLKDLAPSYRDDFEAGFCKIPKLNISSTEIRKKLSMGESVDHMLLPEVVDYIYSHKLYSKPKK